MINLPLDESTHWMRVSMREQLRRCGINARSARDPEDAAFWRRAGDGIVAEGRRWFGDAFAHRLLQIYDATLEGRATAEIITKEDE